MVEVDKARSGLAANLTAVVCVSRFAWSIRSSPSTPLPTMGTAGGWELQAPPSLYSPIRIHRVRSTMLMTTFGFNDFSNCVSGGGVPEVTCPLPFFLFRHSVPRGRSFPCTSDCHTRCQPSTVLVRALAGIFGRGGRRTNTRLGQRATRTREAMRAMIKRRERSSPNVRRIRLP